MQKRRGCASSGRLLFQEEVLGHVHILTSYLIRDGECLIYKADKMPIGIHDLADQSFTKHDIDLKKGDQIYTFSDGYVDQFGGPHGKKFMSKNFRELLLKIHTKSMEEQKQILQDTLDDWMEFTDQIDDVIVMGVRI